MTDNDPMFTSEQAQEKGKEVVTARTLADCPYRDGPLPEKCPVYCMVPSVLCPINNAIVTTAQLQGIGHFEITFTEEPKVGDRVTLSEVQYAYTGDGLWARRATNPDWSIQPIAPRQYRRQP